LSSKIENTSELSQVPEKELLVSDLAYIICAILPISRGRLEKELPGLVREWDADGSGEVYFYFLVS
jgi:hypothetical protein